MKSNEEAIGTTAKELFTKRKRHLARL